MAVSRRTKVFVWATVSVFAVGIAWLAHSFYRGWHKFASEERFCSAFEPVIGAVDRFYERTGTLPTNLTQLVPAYVANLPVIPVADSIEYHVMPDGTNWQITVRSRINGFPRVYAWRSTGQFTDAERQKCVTAFHGWVVFTNQ